jgi:hypothetical protein
MSSKQKVNVLVGAVLMAASAAGFAATDPQAIDVGVGVVIPTLGITEKYDDNIFSQADTTIVIDPTSGTSIVIKPESSMISQLKPVIQWLMDNNEDTIALTYSGDYGFYHSSSDDNYDDHTFSIDAHFQPVDIYSINFGASTAKLHDNRGEGASEGIFAATRNEPDTYDLDNANFLLDFGREKARFGGSVEASHTKLNYTNNRNNTKFRDRRETYVAGRLYGRLSGGKTKYFVEVSNVDFSYTTDPLIGPNLDNDQNVVFVGISWEATGKTSGSIKIGQLDKKFDSSLIKDGDTTVWDVDVTWAPRSYSQVLFSVSKDALESNGTGTFIEAENITVNWIHSWSDRLNSTIGFGLGDDEYPGSTRQDDRTNYNLGLDYDWKRWISVGAHYLYTDRDSNRNTFDFEKNVFLVNFDMTL